ncbi:predicted protein [Naegleria gruberi]|uniref:Predicted protein n=1 Tax=Naegleria gruberi TaxID=5762 RepID=D2V3N5_NAEGR|nr:uncharacterized protein NAEGRDRAFT_46430 [Naegleria gruberi]EFC48668.1 predicted protein [Naegleria gruberi]|eukprot:XP_002681412.1 predicted protein [Naegleria gruberi strain NEG-M]
MAENTLVLCEEDYSLTKQQFAENEFEETNLNCEQKLDESDDDQYMAHSPNTKPTTETKLEDIAVGDVENSNHFRVKARSLSITSIVAVIIIMGLVFIRIENEKNTTHVNNLLEEARNEISKLKHDMKMTLEEKNNLKEQFYKVALQVLHLEQKEQESSVKLSSIQKQNEKIISTLEEQPKSDLINGSDLKRQLSAFQESIIKFEKIIEEKNEEIQNLNFEISKNSIAIEKLTDSNIGLKKEIVNLPQLSLKKEELIEENQGY